MAETEVRGSTQIKDLSIGNTQIASDAAIETTKLADGPSFIQSDGSVAMAANLAMGGNKITGGAAGTASTDFVIYSQLQAIQAGLDPKENVRVATQSNITTLAGGAPDPVDGVSLAANDRVLVKAQSTGSQNGIYVVDTVGTGANGSWSRATDADEDAEVTAGMFMFVSEGTVDGDTQYILTTDDPITVGTTALTFTKFSGGDSQYLLVDGTRTGATTQAQTFTYGLIINEGGNDSDTRIESSGNANMFYVDAGTNMVGIGTTPAYELEVAGDLFVSDGVGMSEQATVPWTAGATEGIFWVKNTTPVTPWFTQGDGSDLELLTSDTAWSLNGNSVSSSTDFIGSTNADDLVIKTNNAEVMRIKSTGDVGLGTSSPVSNNGFARALELNDAGATTGWDLMFTNPTAGVTEYLGFISSNHANDSLTGIGFRTDGATDAGRIEFLTKVTGGSLLEKMRISSSGLVGINKTSSIGAQTHIVSSAVGTVGLRVDSAASPTASAMTLYNNATLTHDFGVKSGGAVVFNENQDNIDFRIEGDTNANLFFVDASADKIGIGTATPDGIFHIHRATAGTIAAHTSYDELVIENNAATGMTFLTPNTAIAAIQFGDPDNNVVGTVGYDHATDYMYFRVNNAERIRVDASGLVGIGTTSPDRRLHTELDDASTNTVLYPFRITRTSSGTPANNIGAGMEFEVETAASNNEIGAIIEVVATDTTATSEDFDIRFKTMAAGAAAANRVWINSTGLGVGASPAYELEVAGDLFVSDGAGMGQQAAAPWTPGSGEGVFWVKNDSPTTPYFTDGGGTDHQLLTTAAITSTLSTREVPSGTINGVNVTFTLANTPESGTEELYLNGVLQNAGAGNDYTISGTTITMAAAPVSGDVLLCSYWY